MAEYQFDGSIVKKKVYTEEKSGLGVTVLLKNARWFIRIRWIVIAALIMAGAAANLFPELFQHFGLIPPRRWPLAIALFLSIANPVYNLLLANIATSRNKRALQTNLWLQIFIDLAALTALVHFTGSLETPIAITYLFHVALACIFFSPKESFWVTVSACALFLTCVSMEVSGILTGGGIIEAASPLRSSSPILIIAGSAATAFSWLIVWYLVSTLSKIIQIRDARLSEANHRLKETMESKNKQMLRTVHDLKAPFASIETMIMALRHQSKDDLPENVAHLMERIEARAKEFRGRIQELMMLGNLRSTENPEITMESFDLLDAIADTTTSFTALAESKDVKVEVTKDPCPISTNRYYLSILLSNLISNAIIYSQQNGTVNISTEKQSNALILKISDQGIGIGEDALPKIFDEFYRTSEAAAHNDQSTGLGLAIVKEVAGTLKFKIQVSSTKGKGTQFSIEIPISS